MRKLVVVLFLLATFSACQTEIYYTRSVVNDTDYDMDLVIISNDAGKEADTIRLDANSTTIIEDFHQLNRPKEGLSCAPERERIVLLVPGFEAILRSDFFNEDNWEKYLIGNRSMEQDCFFQIDDENLLLYNPI
jgi:hypothetical protein